MSDKLGKFANSWVVTHNEIISARSQLLPTLLCTRLIISQIKSAVKNGDKRRRASAHSLPASAGSAVISQESPPAGLLVDLLLLYALTV